MSQKNIAAVLILVATALGTPPLAKYSATGTPEPKVEMVGPETAEVGQLVKLSYDAKRVEWILPTEDQVRVGSDSVVLSFRKPGKYEVTASGVVGDSVQIERHAIEVTAEAAKPGPEPEPSPSPSVSLEDLVYQWCEAVDAPKRACEQLASNFIDAGSRSQTVAELVSNTAKLNRSVNQDGVKEVLVKIQVYLSKELQGKNYIEHQQAWDDISAALLRWSRS